MPARKRAKSASLELESGTPDTSLPPEVKPSVSEPSLLCDRVDDLLREIDSITKHDDFPKELAHDVDRARMTFKVVSFKLRAKR